MKNLSIVLLTIGALLFATRIMSQTSDPGVLLRAAIEREEVDGDLEAAIAQYQQIIANNGNHRSIAAQALLRLGGCYEKLGQEEARTTYEQLIAEYPDQQEQVTTAQAKLAAMGAGTQQAAGVTIRQLRPFGDDGSEIRAYNVSADGRYLGATNYATYNAAIVDLVAGKHWDVTDYGNIGADEFVLVSPDGKRLAFTRSTPNADSDIRIVGSDGAGERVLLESDDIGGWGMPLAWSPDGKYLVVYEEKDHKSGHALVSVDGGEVRVIETLFPVSSGLGFSPDGRFLAYSPFPADGAPSGGVPLQQMDVYVQPVSAGQEMAIAAHPAQDRFIGWSPNGDILFASDRAGSTGLYGVAVEDGRQSGEPRLLKGDIGGINPLGITDAGSLYYAVDRTIRNSFFASIDFSTGRVLSEPEKISDRFEDSTSMPSWSPDGRYLSYLLDRPGAKTTVVIREIASGEERQLLPDAALFPDRSRIQWHADGKSLLALGRKDDETGLLRINAATGEVSLVAPVRSGIAGHATEWTPDAKWLFYLAGPPEMRSIVRRNVETGEEQTIYSSEGLVSQGYRVSPDGESLLLVQWLPEPGRFALRVVPTSGGEYREIFTGRGPLDERRGLSRAWTNDSRHILFPNQRRLWIVPAEGGEARATEIEIPQRIHAISFDPNSDRFAFSTRRMAPTEYWVMEDFLPEPQDEE